MCKLSWSISGLLLIILSIMSYKFIYTGSVEPSSDGRQAIILEESERDLVLLEMRMFLASVRSITEGVSKNDMKQVVKAAREVGAQAQQAVPGSLVAKLPLSFKQLGFDTHKKFDLLALDAETLGDSQHALQQLSELMNNCVACHSTYKINANASMSVVSRAEDQS